jgi:hypothetical protein
MPMAWYTYEDKQEQQKAEGIKKRVYFFLEDFSS